MHLRVDQLVVRSLVQGLPAVTTNSFQDVIALHISSAIDRLDFSNDAPPRTCCVDTAEHHPVLEDKRDNRVE